MKKITSIIKPLIVILILIICIVYTYSLEDFIFESKIYLIDNKYIKGISTNTPINTFKESFDLENCIIKVFNNNKEITDGYVPNNSVTKVYNNSNQEINTYINIIKGDINKDGIVNSKDINEVSKLLINDIKLTEEDIITMDINNDNKVMSNDIALFMDYLDKEYEELVLDKSNIKLMTNEQKRIIPTIKPNIIKDNNLIWKSSNEEIASVNSAGLIIPHKEGVTIISATTKDGKLKKESTVTVDNTIELERSSGKIYIGGNNLKIFIKAVEYNDLTCELNDPSNLQCTINDKYLELSIPNNATSYKKVTVTVNSQKYGSASYEANIVLPYLMLHPPTYCLPTNAKLTGIISSFDSGDISIDIEDNQIIKSFTLNENKYIAIAGTKTGDTNVTLTESNGNVKAIFRAKVYNFSLPNIGYKFNEGDEPKSFAINSGNIGNISCSSEKEEVATCEIKNNELKVIPHSIGDTNIQIKEDKCNAKDSILILVR